MLKFCWAYVKNKMFTVSSRTSRKVVLSCRNDNKSTSFFIAFSPFATCFNSAYLHTSISENADAQEPHLPVSYHNHQTTQEEFLPAGGVLIWPWKQSCCTGSSLDKVTQVAKNQEKVYGVPLFKSLRKIRDILSLCTVARQETFSLQLQMEKSQHWKGTGQGGGNVR